MIQAITRYIYFRKRYLCKAAWTEKNVSIPIIIWIRSGFRNILPVCAIDLSCTLNEPCWRTGSVAKQPSRNLGLEFGSKRNQPILPKNIQGRIKKETFLQLKKNKFYFLELHVTKDIQSGIQSRQSKDIYYLIEFIMKDKQRHYRDIRFKKKWYDSLDSFIKSRKEKKKKQSNLVSHYQTQNRKASSLHWVSERALTSALQKNWKN